MTYYHRHSLAPSWDRPPEETIEAKLERTAGDPFATFGPPRSDRPAFLTADEKTAIMAGVANWLRVGQRVRLVDAPGGVDPAFGIQRFLGRYGVVWPSTIIVLCSSIRWAASAPRRSSSSSCAISNL